MKNFKTRICTIAVTVLGLSYGASAMAIDLTAWRTASLGELQGDTYSVEQMFVGKAFSAAICGSTPPCDVVVKLDSESSISEHTGSFKGRIDVVITDPEPELSALLPNFSQISYKVKGSLDIANHSANGLIKIGGVYKPFTATISGSGLAILQPTPIFSGAVMRVDLTLTP